MSFLQFRRPEVLDQGQQSWCLVGPASRFIAGHLFCFLTCQKGQSSSLGLFYKSTNPIMTQSPPEAVPPNNQDIGGEVSTSCPGEHKHSLCSGAWRAERRSCRLRRSTAIRNPRLSVGSGIEGRLLLPGTTDLDAIAGFWGSDRDSFWTLDSFLKRS